jgi:hypothetical protein
MTAPNERLLELLADRASVGLGAREQIELAELLVQTQEVDAGAFDKAAAAIALASLGTVEKMPAGLAEKLEQNALGAVAARDTSSRPASDFMRTRALDKLAPPLGTTQVDPVATLVSIGSAAEPTDFKRTMAMEDRPAPAPVPSALVPPLHAVASSAPPLGYRPPPPSGQPFGPTSAPPSNVVPFRAPQAPSRLVAVSGWIAAAACLLLAIGALVRRSPPAPVVTLPVTPTQTTATVAPPAVPMTVAALTPAELREKLLAAEGSARAEWTPTKDPLGKSASGEVVWNKEQQKGTMRFKGLAKNDPKSAQYQLWIFDKTRDEKYPVDGGVFDVDSDTGDVVVPIRATLPVNAPVLFAVTLEKPGGVVVSKREHIVVTAKMTAG